MTSKADLRARLNRTLLDLAVAKADAQGRAARVASTEGLLSSSRVDVKTWRDRYYKAVDRYEQAEAKLRKIDEVQHPRPTYGQHVHVKIDARSDSMTSQINAITERAFKRVRDTEEQRLEDELIKIGWNPPLGSNASQRHQKLKEIRDAETRRRVRDFSYGGFNDFGILRDPIRFRF